MITVKIHPEDREFQCAEDDTILRAALRAGLGMPYSCNVGECGNCRFELIEGSVTHLREDPPALTERDLKRNRRLGCQARPDGPCRIKFRADDGCVSKFRPLRRTGELLSITPLNHKLWEFAFQVDGPDDFLPGQYALVSVPEVEGARAYSMCNLPGEGVWSFQIKNKPGGAATKFLFDGAKPGDRLHIDGPYGTAYLREDCPRDLVLLAGGSGLSPMVSIARGAVALGMLDDRKLHFFYGGRTPQDMFDEEMLAKLPGYGERITYAAAISESPDDEPWDGPVGFIHDVARDRLGDALAAHEIYFAGPPIMAGAVQKMMYEAGVTMDQVHFDEFY